MSLLFFHELIVYEYSLHKGPGRSAFPPLCSFAWRGPADLRSGALKRAAS